MPSDSLRLRAITDGIASPWANRFDTICGLAPMTSATAMVSPIARPSPNMTAPTIPPVEWGITTPRIISHRVAPRASAPFLSLVGTVWKTSRRIDVMIGVIMSPTMSPAVMKLWPDRLGPNTRLSTGTELTASAIELKMPLRCGRSVRNAHNPKTTDGTAASTSITVVMAPRIRRVASSVMNRAMPKLMGTATTNAMTETTIVP